MTSIRRRYKGLLRRMFDLSRFEQAGVTLGTIALSAAVLCAFYPSVVVVSIILVVVAHEVGHWTKARKVTRVGSPIFLPLGPVVVGMTPLYLPTNLGDRVEIYQAGARYGLMATATLLGLYLVYPVSVLLFTSIVLSLNEIYSVSFGSDGRRVAKCKQEQ